MIEQPEQSGTLAAAIVGTAGVVTCAVIAFCTAIVRSRQKTNGKNIAFVAGTVEAYRQRIEILEKDRDDFKLKFEDSDRRERDCAVRLDQAYRRLEALEAK